MTPPKCPCKACWSRAIFGRIRPRASLANSTGSLSPAMRASSICLALFPTISVTTELNLIVAVSRILWMRLICRFRSCISWVWVRTRSRRSRIGLGGIKLAESQTVAQEISNPLAILNICFVSRNGVHMLGIDQQDLITAFQQIENGTPIDARAFESHLFHMSLREPVVELSEPIGRRCKGTDRFLDGPLRLAQQPTSYDGFLVHIQTTTAFIHDLHSLSPFRNSFCL